MPAYILFPLCSFPLILHIIFSDSSYHFSIFHKTFNFFPLNFFFLAVLCSLQDLSFLTRDEPVLMQWKCAVLTPEPPGNCQNFVFL